MKIGIFDVQLWEKEYLEDALKKIDGVEVVFSDDALDKNDELEQNDFDVISVFVSSELSEEVLAKFPKLKFIATRSTGFDHIDRKVCAERGIIISNVPTYGENTVAEQAFALLLTLSRRIYEGYEQVREEGSFSHENLQGFDLKGKTIGIIGTGHIGRYAIHMAKGFDMDVIAFDVNQDMDFAKEMGFTYMKLEELLRKSDIVTLHVPYMKATHHLLNEETIALMKPGAILINTARGAIVETAALVKALKEGRLGGAGLDVLEEEQIINDELGFLISGNAEGHDLAAAIGNHVLIDMPNVIITPHNAFNTKEALMRILNTTIENIEGYVKDDIVNIVK